MVIPKNDLLIAFEKVVALKTIHAAAIELGVTQAAITKRIKLLESHMEVSLFIRSRRGMALTPEGAALLQFCKSLLNAEGELLAQISGHTRLDVAVTIVGPTSFVSTRLAANCESIYTSYPFLRLHLRSDDNSNLIEMIRRGEADLAIVPHTAVPNEMESKVLKPDRYLLVASHKWKGRSLHEILERERIIDFYESDETTNKYLAHYHIEKSIKRSRLFVNENEALIRYFKAGIGFGTLTESVARPYLESGALVALNGGKSLEDKLALVWYSRSKQMSYFQDIVRAVK